MLTLSTSGLRSSAALRDARGDLRAALSARNAPAQGTSVWKSWTSQLAAVSALLSDASIATHDYSLAASDRLGSAQALGGLGALELMKRQWDTAATLFEEALRMLDLEEERFSAQTRDLDGANPASSAGGVEGAAGGSGAAAGGEESSPSQAARRTKEEGVDSSEASAVWAVPGAAEAAAPPRRRRPEPAAAEADDADAGTAAERVGTRQRARNLRARTALGAGVAHLMSHRLPQARGRLDEAVVLRPLHSLFNRGVLNMVDEQWEAVRDRGVHSISASFT